MMLKAFLTLIINIWLKLIHFAIFLYYCLTKCKKSQKKILTNMLKTLKYSGVKIVVNK